MIYILYGDDTYSLLNKKNSLLEGLEIEVVDIDKQPISTAFSSIATVDLFGTPKGYVFENTNIFEVKDNKLSKIEKGQFNNLLSLDDTFVFINRKKLSLNSTFYEEYKEKIQYFEFMLDKVDVSSQFEEYIQQNKISINNNAKQELIFNFPNNIIGLTSEIDKLNQYVDNNTITLEVVQEASTRLLESKLFDFQDFILNKDHKSSANFLERLRSEGVDDAEVFFISLLQFRRMYYIKLLLSKGQNSKEIASTLKLNPYFVNISVKKINKLSLESLERLVLFLSEADYNLKTGRVDIKSTLDFLVYESF
ncbi:MAG: DNA polymerase III subunit delta [Mycoplasmatales bacterium]